MKRANSWGSKANRERRKKVADENAQAKQITCMVDDCAAKGTRHRDGRHTFFNIP